MNKPTKKYKALLLGMLREGHSVGNMTACDLLRQKIQQIDNVTITDDDYWAIRNYLIDEGKILRGKGKGGSISLVSPDPASVAETNCDKEDNRERKLYGAVYETITGSWANEKTIAENSFACITAYNKISGKWKNPDICMVSVMIHDFIPGKTMELFTFEVKPNGCFKIEGVFEAASHSVRAHRSYLVIQDRDKQRENSGAFEELRKMCIRFGVGLIIFEEPEAFKTYDTILDAQYQTPDPAETSEFIKLSFPEDLRSKIRERTR